ncbi:hypothetical protein ACMYR3_01645 [Ampullimonas aquatilis]|uniref:hypothetical protein n=1 Tax=Ampullimonas aquatilis TaxID=1341549 RepID=UPI003C750E1A
MADFQWSWNRPLSTFIIHLLGNFEPIWLISTVRLLSILFVFLVWTLLYSLAQPKNVYLSLMLFGITTFSTPVIVEYARYTGMITHLLSGCLGIAAVLSLFKSASLFQDRYSGNTWLVISIMLLILSSLTKEDFVLVYAVSLIYAALHWPLRRKTLLVGASSGLLVCLILITASKLFASSEFLGVTDQTSTYYINLSPISIIKTVLFYLLSNSHPAMKIHGWIVLSIFCLTVIFAIILIRKKWEFSKTIYFLLGSLTLIAPYSVLPNHINPYYEIVWLPMLISAVVMGAMEVISPSISSPFLRTCLPSLILLITSFTFSFSDFEGRKSIASWYDIKNQSNIRILSILEQNKALINYTKNTCIYGADNFSPWYMHGGQYLTKVMGLDSNWFILSAPTSDEYTGLNIGAANSKKNVLVINNINEFPLNCTHLNLRK